MAARKRVQGAAVPMPDFVPFQHPKMTTSLPEGSAWVHEVKLDGYRMQVRTERGRVRISTRNGLDWTSKFRALEALAGELPDCILDGELVALDDKGEPNFSKLRSAIARANTDALIFYAFDILFEGRDNDLRPYPLRTRKARLAHVLEDGGEHIADTIRFVEPLSGSPAALLRAACALKWEGIVSKRLDAPYRGGKERPDSWLKAKCRPSAEAVIGGWTADGPAFGRILCGVPDEGGGLRYIGSVDPGRVPGLARRLEALRAQRSPFTSGPLPARIPDVHWAKPHLVVDIEIAEFTASGKMRQPAFKRLRTDKTAAEVNPDLDT